MPIDRAEKFCCAVDLATTKSILPTAYVDIESDSGLPAVQHRVTFDSYQKPNELLDSTLEGPIRWFKVYRIFVSYVGCVTSASIKHAKS